MSTPKVSAKELLEKTGNLVNNATSKIVDVAGTAKETIVKQLDQNGDGVVGIEDIIVSAIKVSRSPYYKSQFSAKRIL